MAKPVETVDGWYVLHDFRSVDWTAWKGATADEREEALAELQDKFKEWTSIEKDKNGSFGFYTIIGQKADLLFMHLRPTMEELTELEFAFNKLMIAEFLEPAYSYVSVVELSTYLSKPEDMENNPEIQARLHPILPKWNNVCFYPMDKRREVDDNWYSQDFDLRAKLMYDHGMTGRQYAGKVRQIVTGSIGFDDWEWGVTLFAHDILQIKKLIYEMRFDEVSARFAEFGAFYIGHRKEQDDLKDIFAL